MLEGQTYERHPHLTTFETFHWIAARGVELLGSDSISSVRLVCTLLGLLAVVAAYKAARAVHDDAHVATLRAATVLLLPILLPFLFLIYTDALALAAIGFAVWATERKRYLLAATFGILAVAIRQMNIVWLAWLFALYLLRERPWIEVRTRWPARLLETAPYALGALAFLVFVHLNRGVAIGDPLSHPFGLYDENPFFFLLIAWITLLPVMFARVPEVVAMLRRHPVSWAAAGIVLVVWFTCSWKADHWYNVLPHHVHNEVAMWLNDVGNRVVVAPMLAWSLFSVVEVLRPRAETALWLVATCLLLLPSYMIEPRYAIVPLALFTIYRPTLPAWQEGAAFAWMALLGVAAFTLTSRGAYTI